jgi:hypothetical protein
MTAGDVQLCPKCDGTGLMSRPPGIAGDQPTWTSHTLGPYVCNLCDGHKVIGVAAQLAAERERVLAPIRALAEEWEREADRYSFAATGSHDDGLRHGLIAAVVNLRAVLPPITQAAAPAASPATTPEGKP